ncbi:sensor histidine kinase [Winogradskyella tangerina]|uniref:sensor histidine kinase n=1 Tax=Winogradskyella tangerina TaxID=2023240 RepID=UPI000DBE54B2|nr:ATP-binding protein [Winogradskyella tangerina]
MRYSYNIFSRVLLFAFLVSINGVIQAQNDCQCSVLDNSKENIKNVELNDSLGLFSKINPLKNSNEKICEFEGLDLEFKYYSNLKNNEQLLSIIESQEQILKLLDCPLKKTRLTLNKTIYYRAINDYEKLSEFAFKTLAASQKLGNTQTQIEAYKHLVFLFTRLNEDKKRWHYVKQAEHHIYSNEIKIPNYRWLSYQYENEFTKTERKTLIDSALHLIESVKPLAKKQKNYRELTLLYRALEAFAYHDGNLPLALTNIDTAIYYGKQIKGAKNLSGLYLSKAWDHFDLNQLKEAEQWTDSMLKYDIKNDIGGYMMTLLQAAELYEGTGNTEKALTSFKAHQKLKDSLLKIERISAINELETKYQTELKDAELKLKDSKINRLTILVIISILLVLAILLITKVRQLRKAKVVNVALQNAIDTQARLEKEIVNVRENIAQDFHDELGNKLARISLLSNLIQKDTKKEKTSITTKVQQITEDARSLYLGTRDFIFSLKSNSDCLEEVVTYLSDFGEDFFSKSAIKFQLKKSIDKDVKLPFYWSKQLIYIFKEAMTNSLKHSKCTKVILSFKFEADLLEIKLTDNGIGIDAEDLRSENGLGHMKKRAEKINSELQFISTQNDGTTVYFKGKTT